MSTISHLIHQNANVGCDKALTTLCKQLVDKWGADGKGEYKYLGATLTRNLTCMVKTTSEISQQSLGGLLGCYTVLQVVQPGNPIQTLQISSETPSWTHCFCLKSLSYQRTSTLLSLCRGLH